MTGKNSSVIEMSSSPKKVHGSVVSFHNISYSVNVPKTCCGSCRRKDEIQILKDVSGIIKPGLNAIMGPTGSGKTSLLDVLANRKDPDCVAGDVLLDGKNLPKNYHYISGYVVQNDMLVGTITVRESLWFCANLRLSTSVSHQEKKERIERTLEELGLKSCADSKIGNEIIRGISGGEKKRTSIALELILEPRILFLDEPTTGLDAATAHSVMILLKKLGLQGHTIVCSIHQPRFGIFKLFNSLTLLSEGKMVYHGPGLAALEYFQNLGYKCEEHDNPADFFLDLLNGVHEQRLSGSPTFSEETETLIATDFVVKTEKNLTTSLAESYIQSDQYKTTHEELTKINQTGNTVKVKSGQMYATSTFHQLKVLLGRTAKNTIRNPQALAGNAFTNIVIGLIFGMIYYQTDSSPVAGIQNRVGILFFICTNLLFGSVNVVDIFAQEKEIFIHEYVSGYYRVISYFLSKLLADLIPLRTISPMIFGTITYWMVGLKADAGAFFIFLLTTVVTGYSSVAIGIFYSSSFKPAISQILLVLTFVFTILFSGLLVNVDSIMPWLSWLKYLSVARYGLVALAINELRNQTFTSCGNDSNVFDQSSMYGSLSDAIITRLDNSTVCLSIKGEEFVHTSLVIGESADAIDDWDLWQNIVALGCISFGLFVLTYIQLLRTRTYS